MPDSSCPVRGTSMAEPDPALIEDLLATTFRARVIVAGWQRLALYG
jgi:hypothetical protein